VFPKYPSTSVFLAYRNTSTVECNRKTTHLTEMG